MMCLLCFWRLFQALLIVAGLWSCYMIYILLCISVYMNGYGL